MAIYRPTNLQPNSIEIDATESNNFTCIIQGTIARSYNLTIFRVSDNAQIYTTNEVTLTTPLYNGDMLTVAVPNTSGMVNGASSDYKWQIRIYEVVGSMSDSALSDEVRFFARSNPVVTITNTVDPVTSRNYVFTGSYTQAEGVSLRYHQWILYDSTGNTIIDQTGQVDNANIRYDYDRYLNGESYQLELVVVNQNGTTTRSTRASFAVVYSVPSISFTVLATNNPDDDSVHVGWNNAVQITGTAEGTVNYLEDTPFTGTDSVQINGDVVFYDEQNGEQLNLESNNTAFEHTNFAPTIYTNSQNRLSGSGWEINGVLFTHEDVDGSNRYLKILSFELDSFRLHTQFSASAAPILVAEYRVYGAQNLFALQPSATPTDSLYVWDDNENWDDTYFWVDGEDISSVWWKLAWIHPTASTHELVWNRSVDS